MSNNRPLVLGVTRRTIAASAVGVILLVAALGACVHRTFVHETIRHACEVTDKDRAGSGDGESSMRVYTSNCGVFSVEDNYLKGVWNSSDIFGAIEVGKSYDFTTTGFRFGFTSSFPAIIKADEIGGTK